jgi:acyl-CoA thioesterase
MHPFDEAIRLQAAGPATPDVFTGVSSPAYWNMVGPFGGITTAIALQAVLQHPALLGEPLSITVNFAAAAGPGAFRLVARPLRTNRSTQHWFIEMTQPDAEGGQSLVMSATAVTAVRRQTWSQNDSPMPVVPLPQDCSPAGYPDNLAWTQRYDIRVAHGDLPRQMDGSGEDSLSRLWLRDNPARPLDFAALSAMADAFYPRIWLRRARLVPAGTVSVTVYFHTGAADLARSSQGYLLGQAQAQTFQQGFFDQAVQLWSKAGELLATAHQIVYFKE